jgi:hypothetical protein
MLDEAHRASESQAAVPDSLWSYSLCDGASCREGAATFQGDPAQGCKAGYTLVPSSAALPFVRHVSILDSNSDKALAIDFQSRRWASGAPEVHRQARITSRLSPRMNASQ